MLLDETVALDTLSKVSFFRLKPYWWDMRDLETDEDFLPNSNLALAIQRYDFDRVTACLCHPVTLVSLFGLASWLICIII